MSVFDLLWQYREFIESALAYGEGTHTFDDVAAAVLTGRMQLWPAGNGCLVTEVIGYPRRRVLQVFLGAGDMGTLKRMHRDVERWALQAGCDAMCITGRKGWGRALADHGWRETMRTFEKRII